MKNDPLMLFSEIFSRAWSAEGEFYNAAALATAGEKQRPAVRMVLVKHADAGGFVFYTNLFSRKARELASNSRAALCFWWPRLETQVRVEGTVTSVDDAEADAYFASRPRGSQIGAWASRQSERLSSREALLESAADVARRYENKTIPRPPHWSGFRLVPESIEFWRHRPDRLHERRLYVRKGNRWEVSLLHP